VAKPKIYLPAHLMPRSRPNPYLAQLIKAFTPEGKISGQQSHEWENVGALPNFNISKSTSAPVGVFNRVIDILSRPAYGVAAGMKSFQRESVDEGGILEKLGAWPSGFVRGFTGKEKANFSQVIQQETDIVHGVDVSDPSYDPNKGVHKVNPVLKYGGGLALDIALDPTTYVGIGLVSKAAKNAPKILALADEGAKILGTVQDIEKSLGVTAKAGKKATTVIAPEIDKVLGLDTILKGKNLTAAERAAKLNSPQFQKFVNLTGIEAAKVGKVAGEVSAQAALKPGAALATEMAKLQAKFGNRPIFANVQAAAAKRAAQSEARVVREAGEQAARASAVAKQQEVAEFAARVLETTHEARIGLKVAGKTIASTKIPEAARFIHRARQGEGVIAHTVKTFDRAFNNGTGRIGKEINEFRLIRSGQAESRIRAHLDELLKKYGPQAGVRKVDRVNSWKLIKVGGDVGQLDPVGKQMFQDLNDTLNIVQSAGYRMSEINRWMPKEMRFSGPKDDWLDSWKNWTHPDGAEVLWSLRNAVEQAASIHGTHTAFSAGFGVKITEANKGVAQTLSKLGYRHVELDVMTKGKPIKAVPKELEGVLVHPEVAQQYENIMNIVNKPLTHNQMLDLNDKVVNIWKRVVTMYNPSYHIRNAQTDIILNMMAGVVSPKSYTRALNIMRRYDKNFANAVLRGDAVWDDLGVKAARVKTKWGWTSEDRLWTAYHQMGLAQSFTRGEFTSVAREGAEISGAISSKIGHASEVRENYFRLTHFVDKVLRSKAKTFDDAITEVAAEVRKYHFDYSDFTHVERNVFARVIPFYKWTRKALPLMIEQTFTHPGRAMIPTKYARTVSQLSGFETDNSLLPSVDESIPDWLKEGGAVPIGHYGDNTVYMDQRGFNPWADAIQFMSNPINALAGGLTPTARIPIELQTGKSLFTGGKRPPLGAYALQQIPFTNMAAKIERSEEGGSAFTNPAFLNWLTGVGLRENTQQMQESARRAERRR